MCTRRPRLTHSNHLPHIPGGGGISLPSACLLATFMTGLMVPSESNSPDFDLGRCNTKLSSTIVLMARQTIGVVRRIMDGASADVAAET